MFKKLFFLVMVGSFSTSITMKGMGIFDTLKTPGATKVIASVAILAGSYAFHRLSKYIVSDGEIQAQYEIQHGKPYLIITNYDKEEYNTLCILNFLATYGAILFTWWDDVPNMR